MKRIIKTPDAPLAIGPYSQAVEINGMLFVSGQIAIDPSTARLVEGDISIQTARVLKNTEAILKAAGYSFQEVVKSTVYLTDISNFRAMNEVYAKFYTENPPARAAVGVKELPLGALIEIEAVAMK
jgi:2-iminobutanoate/2-iminopropanoate deaminase